MAKEASTPGKWEVVALAYLLAAHCLRRSEAISVGEGDNKVKFQGTKSRRGEQEQEWGRWGTAWLKFLCYKRWRDTTLTGGRGYSQRQCLATPWSNYSISRDEPGGGGGRKTIRWHSLRRLEEAQLERLGVPLSLVMLGGGGGSAANGWRTCTCRPPRDGTSSGALRCPCQSGRGKESARRRWKLSLDPAWTCEGAGATGGGRPN